MKFGVFVWLLAGAVIAGNPVIKDIGMSDPHVRIFDEKVYLYCGHDAHPDDRTWMMHEWRIFSTTNLVDWVQEGSISPKDNYMPNDSHDCWATDAAERNGKYYFYFSDQKRGVGVMTSDAPGGPFVDPLGKPLVSPMHDPTILIDDDAAKTPYMVYGDKAGSYHVVKLNDDMISLAEKPKPITISGEQWKKAPHWMDKNYIFKYDGSYYLSWGGDYAISKNIYGPYECVGAVGKGYELGMFAHGSFFWWKGQFYHMWCYYLRPGYKYRESIITYCHFDRDGKIVTDTAFLDAHFANGVGQYDASWPQIEAEWFYEKSGGTKQQTEDGFEVAGLKDGEWLRFANMRLSGAEKMFSAKVTGSGTLELRKGSPDGALLCEIIIESGMPVSGTVKTDAEKLDIYLVFRGKKDARLAIDSFAFSQ